MALDVDPGNVEVVLGALLGTFVASLSTPPKIVNRLKK
jgi:hypothetical protein